MMNHELEIYTSGQREVHPKDRLLWFEADMGKRLYLQHCYLDLDIVYTE